MKWVHLNRAKSTLKIMLASWTFDTILKRLRSFITENFGFVGQRAAKLLAIKLWEWLDRDRNRTRADCFEWGSGRLGDFSLRPPALTAGNFEALWPKDTKFLALKDLNLLKRYSKSQEKRWIFRIDFALSNWPHFPS